MLVSIKRESRIAIAVLFAALFNVGILSAQTQLSIQTHQTGFYALEMNGQFFDFNNTYYTLHHLAPGIHQVRLHQWNSSFGNQGSWSLIHHGPVHVVAMQNTILNYSPMFGVQIHRHPIMNAPNMPIGGVPFPGHMQPGWFLGMDAAAFQHFITEFDRISFDSNKISYAQFAIRNSGIQVHQLSIILQKMSFDKNRLELAIFAYPYTIDRQNYFMLRNAFSFQSNFRKLMESLG